MISGTLSPNFALEPITHNKSNTSPQDGRQRQSQRYRIAHRRSELQRRLWHRAELARCVASSPFLSSSHPQTPALLLPLPLPPSSSPSSFLLPPPLPPSPSSFPLSPPPPSLPPDVLGPLLVSILTQNIEKGVDNALNGIRDKASSMGSSASAMSDPMTSSIEASAEGADPMATGARRTGAALDVSGLPPGCWDSTDEFVPARLPAPRWGMGLAVPSELAVHESNGC